MARKRKVGVEVTLFPFLSVLVCVIGALSLLIITTTMGGTVEDEQDGSPPEPTTRQVGRARLEGQKDLAQARVEADEELLRQLLEQLRQITLLQEGITASRKEAIALQPQALSLEAALKDLLAKIAQRAKELEALKEKLKDLAPDKRKVTLPEALRGKHKYNPIFVECRASGIVILQNQKHIPAKEIESSQYLQSLLGDIKTAGNWCLFMLVRRDGVKAFNDLYFKVQRANIPHGYHPVYSDEDLDVSDWANPNWLK